MLNISLPHQWGLIVCIAVGLSSYVGMAGLHLQQGTLRDEHTPHTLGWYGLAFVGYLAALIWVERRGVGSLLLIWSAAIIFRLLLLFTVPTLSDDVYRYMWDGYVANNGVSPYAYPIDAPELDYLDTPQRALANNRWMASPYLPAAQLLFAALARFLPPNPLYFQIVMIIFDLLAALLIVKLLTLVRQPAHRILIYLWNPLVIVEIAHGAHIDGLMVCLTLLAIWLTLSPRQTKLTIWLAPVALALATLTKVLPIFLLPILIWRWRWRQLFLYGLVIIGLATPFGLSAGWGLTGPLNGAGLFGAIRIYADQWNFNSGLFHWLEVDWLPLLGIVQPTVWAKRIVGAGMFLVLSAVWLEARRSLDIYSTLRLMAVPFMAYLLLTTTVHPWYMLVLMVFLPFLAPTSKESPWRWLILTPWLYLSAGITLSYLTYLTPLNFREFEWVRQTEWWPVWGLLAVWGIYGFIGYRQKLA